MILCKYGCGNEGVCPIKCGGFCCSNSHNKCPVNRKKNGESNNGMKGKHHSKESKEKMSKAKKGKKRKPFSEETKEKMSKNHANCSGDKNSKGMNGKHHSKESKEKMREVRKRKPSTGMNGKHHSKESKTKQSESMKQLWADPNSVYHTEEYWQKVNLGEDIRPNKPEIKILNILNEIFPNEWKYVGDFKFWIDGKNPDFINHNEKKIIEHFGIWYHGRKMTGKEEKLHEQERISHFKKEGYDTLIIWENELKDIEKLKGKIIQFNKEKL